MDFKVMGVDCILIRNSIVKWRTIDMPKSKYQEMPQLQTAVQCIAPKDTDSQNIIQIKQPALSLSQQDFDKLERVFWITPQNRTLTKHRHATGAIINKE